MKKPIKFALSTLISILILGILLLLGYLMYVIVQYDRIEDLTILDTENNKASYSAKTGTEITIATYNIGFGAYGQEYSFFMDTGIMSDEKKTKGKYGKSISEKHTMDNTLGAIDELKALDADIILVQEVDVASNRAYDINQAEIIKSHFPEHSFTYCSDFHTAYLFYPLSDPHGKTEAGLVTLSKLSIEKNIRYSYPVPSGFAKFFDLDRCFSLHRIPVDNGKELIIINSHMSAYDKGGTTRAKQMQLLTEVMQSEYDKGNYVIVGGDFNHALGEDIISAFDSKQRVPEWIAVIDEKDLPSSFEIAQAENRFSVPTVRGADIPWEKGTTYTTVIDGFIVSDNIEYKTENIETDFKWSDHQPVKMTFKLKP